MRVLITGSQGTIGRKLRAELEARGHDVWGTDLMHAESETYRRADIANRAQLEEVFKEIQPGMVYHLAAEFGRLNGERFSEQLWITNCIGTKNVLKLCDQYGSSLVFASTSEVYGESTEGEFMRESDTYLTPSFSNEYAISKFTNELQIRNFQNRSDLPVLILRFFNAYGPGERYHPYRSVVALFVYRALSGIPWDVYSGYHRTFMFIDDFTTTLANVANASAKVLSGDTINVGGIDYRSVEELSSLVIKAVGCDPSLARLLPPEEHNVRNKKPDISKARSELGHDPQVTLEQGIPLTVAWMKKEYGF